MSAFGIFVQLSGRIFALPKGVLFAVDHERFSRTPDSAGGLLQGNPKAFVSENPWEESWIAPVSPLRLFTGLQCTEEDPICYL